MDEQKNTQLIKHAYSAFQKGDVPTILKMISSDFEWSSPELKDVPFSGSFRGREKMAEYFKSIGENLDILRFEPQNFIAQNDIVVVLGEEQCRVKSTGKVYQNKWSHVFMVRNGIIMKGTEYSNTIAVMSAFQESKVFA